LTFIAPANAVRYAGAHPVFVDAEPRYWQLDVAKLEDFLTRGCTRTAGQLRNRATGRRVAAILPVHILGGVCDIEAILDLGRRFEIPIVEDATEALGAAFRERSAGSFGLAGCFSFNGNKLLTTGGGGMVVTDDERVAARAKYLTTQAKDDAVEFVHGAVGFNYRLPNVLAAIGCAQLEQLGEYVNKKRAVATAYRRALGALPGIEPMPETPGTASAFWMYTVRVDAAQAGVDSRQLMGTLEARHIQSRPLWQPMHLSPAHRESFATDCTVAERLNRECLSLPCSVGLTAEDQQRVIDAVTARVGAGLRSEPSQVRR
jgi:perosamine synthetase